MTWQTEFPDFPAADMPAIPEAGNFADTSWHNDACPSFTSDQLGITIWIDYLDPAAREIAGPRFNVTPQDHGVETSGESLSTDDWQAVLAFLAEQRIKRCRHRDDGRGRCIDCGTII